MATQEQTKQKRIRDLMPPNYLPELVKRTGLSTPTIFRVVKAEQKTSKAWPAVLQLAHEHQLKLEQQKQQERELGLAS